MKVRVQNKKWFKQNATPNDCWKFDSVMGKKLDRDSENCISVPDDFLISENEKYFNLADCTCIISGVSIKFILDAEDGMLLYDFDKVQYGSGTDWFEFIDFEGNLIKIDKDAIKAVKINIW